MTNFTILPTDNGAQIRVKTKMSILGTAVKNYFNSLLFHFTGFEVFSENISTLLFELDPQKLRGCDGVVLAGGKSNSFSCNCNDCHITRHH